MKAVKNSHIGKTGGIPAIMLSVILLMLAFPMSTFATSQKIAVNGRVYEFDEKNDYMFSETMEYRHSLDVSTYGVFSISSNAELVTAGSKEGVAAYSIDNGNIEISYTYSDDLLNASIDEWHLIEDKEKNVDIYKLNSVIKKGALILQRSIDHLNWSDVSIQTNAFENTPIQKASLYETLDVELINGCYYRLIVAYELSRRVDTSNILWVFPYDKYENKRIAEVYEFYASLNSEHIEDLQESTKRYRLGEVSKVSDFASYSGKEEIQTDDIHYNWRLGDFFVSGFTSTTEKDGDIVFLKNVGDVVTLWFNLNQDINALNNNKNLTITSDGDGQDQYFGTPKTNFGRGMLIIRHTDYENVAREPVMYYNFLEANTSLGANTRVQLFEEGDYEVALDYEVTKDQALDKIGHYRIFFKFSVRNANCMVYPFDIKTKAELTNGSVTPNGFYLDLAKSRYLKIFIRKEIWVEGTDGLTEDTKFNTETKDGDKYTEEGIYTITVKNKYTDLQTEKVIYVGTNRFLMAYMTSNYSLSEIQDLVAEGAIIYEDGSIEMPPKTYNITHRFVSGTSGMELPDGILELIPMDQTGLDGSDVVPDIVEQENVKVEKGNWVFQGWDADKKTINGKDIVFIGLWEYEADPELITAAVEIETEKEDEVNSTVASEVANDTEKVVLNESIPNNSTESPSLSETLKADEPIEIDESTSESPEEAKKGDSGASPLIVFMILAAGVGGFLVYRKRYDKPKEEQK